MPRKKILWLCSWYPGKTEPFNGDFIQRHAHAAALYNDIHVIHVTGDVTGQIKKTGEEISSIQGLTEHIIYFKKSTSFLGKLMSHYRWLLLFRHAIRKYITENGKPDLVHVTIPIKAGIPGMWMKQKYNLPFVLTEHWGIYNEVEVHNYAGKSGLFKSYTKKIFMNAAKFISVSKFLAEGVNKIVIKKEYIVIPNVADTGLFFYKEKQKGVFRFIHVSNMVPLKNAEGILRAFKLLLQQNKDAELVMVGDTDPAIRKYAKELNPEANVIFRGEVSYGQVAAAMQQSDCFILFSNIENSPCVIGEALCCGLPVIASNVGGIPELVDGTNSLLVEAGNEQLLATAMAEMMHSTYDRKKIAEVAQGKFSYPVIGKMLDEVYGAVLSSTGND